MSRKSKLILIAYFLIGAYPIVFIFSMITNIGIEETTPLTKFMELISQSTIIQTIYNYFSLLLIFVFILLLVCKIFKFVKFNLNINSLIIHCLIFILISFISIIFITASKKFLCCYDF
jgi:hypothetical protein